MFYNYQLNVSFEEAAESIESILDNIAQYRYDDSAIKDNILGYSDIALNLWTEYGEEYYYADIEISGEMVYFTCPKPVVGKVVEIINQLLYEEIIVEYEEEDEYRER